MMFYKESHFKETNIGNIPEDWEAKQLNEITERKKFSIVDGPFGTQLHSNEYVDQGVPLIRVNDIKRDGSFGFDELVYITEEKFEKLNRSAVYPGDILLAKTGATIGKVCIFPANLERGLIASSCAKISIDNLKADNRYVFYFLLSAIGYAQILALATGATRPTINLTPIGKIRVLLPKNIAEQRKIVEVLSVVDLAIRKVDEVIAKTERLKKGLMQELLTKGIGHKEFKDTKIGKIPKTWEVEEIKNLGELQYGYTTSARNENTGTKFLRVTDIKDDGRIKWDAIPYCHIDKKDYRKYALEEEDILFARIGATAGKTGFIDRKTKGIFASYLIRLKINKGNVLPKFVFYFTQSSAYWLRALREREGQLKKGINATMLSKFQVPVPPVPEQQKIAEIISAVDQKLELERHEKVKLENIKRGLMDLLLTGKIRVKVD